MRNATRAWTYALVLPGIGAAVAAEPADERHLLTRYEERLSKHPKTAAVTFRRSERGRRWSTDLKFLRGGEAVVEESF